MANHIHAPSSVSICNQPVTPDIRRPISPLIVGFTHQLAILLAIEMGNENPPAIIHRLPTSAPLAVIPASDHN